MTKITIDRAVVEQALEALKLSTPKTRRADDDYAEQGWEEHNAAITDLRAALAEPVQEPVAAERDRLLSLAKRRADHEASAAAHHAGRWHAAHEYHLTRHAAMRDLIALLAEPQEPDLSRCPKCNGPADNGHDREVPPNAYWCTKCMAEPVAWLFTNLQSGDYDFCYQEDEHDHDREMWHKQPLYTAPPQRPAEPVQEPVAQISANRVIAAIEEWKSLWWKVPPFASKVNRATREAITVSHNPLFALLLDAQEAKQMPKGCTTPSGCQQHGDHGECLPAPPQRKPLTEVEIEMAYRDIWRDLPTDFYRTSFGWIEQGIRYAERAHGIGETK